MGTVETAGASVSYAVDGHGPGLVLVHGTGGNADSNWAHLVPELAKTWTVVRPDYSGSGATRDGGGPLTVEGLAAQVAAAARAAGAVPFHLVGFSLGSAVAVQVAADHPGLVRSLVLLGAFAGSDDPRQRMQFGLWRDLIRTDRRAMARLVMLTGFSPDFLSRMGEAAIAEAIDAIVAGNDWEGIARQVALDLTLDVRAALPRIACPTVVIGAGQDQMVPPALGLGVARAIAGARYVEMETGHLAALEQPDRFLALLRTFLEP